MKAGEPHTWPQQGFCWILQGVGKLVSGETPSDALLYSPFLVGENKLSISNGKSGEYNLQISIIHWLCDHGSTRNFWRFPVPHKDPLGPWPLPASHPDGSPPKGRSPPISGSSTSSPGHVSPLFGG